MKKYAYHIPHDASPPAFLLQLVNDHSINPRSLQKFRITHRTYVTPARKQNALFASQSLTLFYMAVGKDYLQRLNLLFSLKK